MIRRLGVRIVDLHLQQIVTDDSLSVSLNERTILEKKFGNSSMKRRKLAKMTRKMILGYPARENCWVRQCTKHRFHVAPKAVRVPNKKKEKRKKRVSHLTRYQNTEKTPNALALLKNSLEQ